MAKLILFVMSNWYIEDNHDKYLYQNNELLITESLCSTPVCWYVVAAGLVVKYHAS